MTQTDRLKKYLDAGVAFTHLTQQRAEEIVRELVKAGEVKKRESQARVEELLERSKQTTDALRSFVETEVGAQIGRLGLATKAEVDELQRQVESLKRARATKAAKAPAARKASTRKTAAPADGADPAPS